MCIILILVVFGVQLVCSKFIENEPIATRSLSPGLSIEDGVFDNINKSDWPFTQSENSSLEDSGISSDEDSKQSSTIIACIGMVNCSRNSDEFSESLSTAEEYVMSDESSHDADRRYDQTKDSTSNSNEYFYVRHSNARPRHSFEKYGIDYKKTYGLRFDPNTIKRSSSYYSQQNSMQQDSKESNSKNNSTEAIMKLKPTEETKPMIVQDNIEDFSDSDVSSNEAMPTKPSNLLDFEDYVESINVNSSFVSDPIKPLSIIQIDDPENVTTNIMNPIRPNGVANYMPDKLKQMIFMDPSFDQYKVQPGQRFLSIFDVIKFRNEPCISLRRPLRPLNGTCYHKFECDAMGGVAVDVCAGGFGVCCVFQLGCGGVVRQNVSYFKSPGFPRPFRDKVGCTLTVELLRGTKQVLLEFIFFELKPPVKGDCIEDQFIVSGHSSNFRVPTICGINTGQHMFIDVEDAIEGRLFLSVVTSSIDNRAFNIRVTQYKENVTPKSCLQYFDTPTGTVQSFNYDDQAKIQNPMPSYFNNLNYVICIRRLFGFCEITYSNVLNGTEFDFEIKNVDKDGLSLVPPRQAGVEIFSCPQDFIAVNAIRLCGERLNDGSKSADFHVNSPVTGKSAGPIIIPVRTDKEVVGRGFKLFYTQIPC